MRKLFEIVLLIWVLAVTVFFGMAAILPKISEKLGGPSR